MKQPKKIRCLLVRHATWGNCVWEVARVRKDKAIEGNYVNYLGHSWRINDTHFTGKLDDYGQVQER